MGTADQIQPGEDVRASYQVIDGQPTALKLTVTSSRSKSSTGQSQSGQSQSGQSQSGQS
jgi:hypothetical protein